MTNSDNTKRRSHRQSANRRRGSIASNAQHLTESQMLNEKKEEAFQQIKMAFTVGFRF